MDFDNLPVQLRAVMRPLAHALASREPAIRAGIDQLRAKHPGHTNDELAQELIRSTRRRVAATGALSGAVSIAPGLGTLLAVGTVTSQALYALEQETELVLGVAMIYGHELASSDDRLIEALVVVGIAGGAVKLRENVLVAGGERIAISAFRKLPRALLAHGGSGIIARILAKLLSAGAMRTAARVVPFAVGLAVGAGFDWLTVTGLGKVAVRYYGPGGPGARALLLAPEDRSHVELNG